MASSFFTRHSSSDEGPRDRDQQADPDQVTARLDEAVARWRRELLLLTETDGEEAPRLTIGQAHPGGLAQLYTEHPTRLALLVREAASHRRALERARQIIARSEDLAARHGVGTIHLSIGQARWETPDGPVFSAAILRPVALAEQGDDVVITLLPGTGLDPVLRSALRNGGMDINPGEVVARATTAHGFSASRALADLRLAGAVLDRFELRDELVLGIFEHPASGLLRELDAAPTLASSILVRALAGDPDAAAQTRAPLPTPDPGDRDPWRERGVGDLTPRQQDVVEAVSQGRSLVVDVPDGADDTAVVAAILADAGASGRSVVHIGGSPSRTARAEERLRDLGLDEMTIRLDGASRAGRALAPKVRAAMSDTTPVADQHEVDEMRADLKSARQVLASYTTSLHQPFGAFGVSAFDTLQVLTDLTSGHPAPATRVRLPEEVLYAIGHDRGEAARDLLHRACRLGIFSRSTAHAAWRGIVINAREQVSDALTRITRLSTRTLPELRLRMSAVAGEAGIAPATSLVEWEEQLRMFDGVRDVLDVFHARVFERSAADMVIATASKDWRRAHGITMKRAERIRLTRQAEDLVRPGVHVENLHRMLLLVQERRDAWRAVAEDDGWPTLPQRLDEAEQLTADVREDLERLAPMFSTAHPHLDRMPVADLAGLLERLDADQEGARELPRRVAVLKDLAAIGLDPLVQDLRERHVDEGLIDAELDLAWWASLLGLMLAGDSRLGGIDPARLEASLAVGRARDLEQVESLAPQAIGQLRRLRLQALATRPEQHADLAAALDADPADLDLLERFPLVRHLVPVALTVPTLVPALVPEGHRVDLLVLDDVDALPLAELVPIVARARQVVLLSDLAAARPDGPARALASVLPSLRMDVSPARLNDQVALILARHGIDHTGVPVPWTATDAPVTAVWCDGSGMPALGASAVESTAVEVDAVIDLVVEHAVEQPDRSLAVIALNERHAERIRQAVSRLRAAEPGLAGFFDPTRAEPFAVVGPAGAKGLSHDRAMICVGFAKTPHGRVIHDFGELSGEHGGALMGDVLKAVRGDLTVVSSLRPGDLDRSRLTTDGPRILIDLLEVAEGQSGRTGEQWPVLEEEPDRLLVDLADRLYGMGLEVVPNVGVPGGMRIPLAIGHPEVPGRLLVAVLTDDEAYVREPSLRVRDRMWPAMLQAQGWKVHTALSMAVFIDPAKEADAIVQLVLDAVDEFTGAGAPVVEIPREATDEIDAVLDEEAGAGPSVDERLDGIVAETSLARERSDARSDEMATGGPAEQDAAPDRGPRPSIARGLPLAAYSDDQLDEMAAWVSSDGVERTDEEAVEELRLALGITRRGFQSDAVLGNVVRRIRRQAERGRG
ncbi:prevent-host-death family protein [Actinomyces sp. B33]|uniref:prevent-host-death family protein n=1 Tax=Actinomyces sp. B33 TaxID=2942131 RepID=UPI002341053D|nr:prevent-host-death family protein [Actinomyces sp. B33]MDC4232179.1 prevent-host-death family protein [Actinomyces sp. B33]